MGKVRFFIQTLNHVQSRFRVASWFLYRVCDVIIDVMGEIIVSQNRKLDYSFILCFFYTFVTITDNSILILLSLSHRVDKTGSRVTEYNYITFNQTQRLNRVAVPLISTIVKSIIATNIDGDKP